MRRSAPELNDLRPVLRVAWQTWEREDQTQLRREADRLGFRLVVVDDAGCAFEPPPDLTQW